MLKNRIEFYSIVRNSPPVSRNRRLLVNFSAVERTAGGGAEATLAWEETKVIRRTTGKESTDGLLQGHLNTQEEARPPGRLRHDRACRSRPDGSSVLVQVESASRGPQGRREFPPRPRGLTPSGRFAQLSEGPARAVLRRPAPRCPRERSPPCSVNGEPRGSGGVGDSPGSHGSRHPSQSGPPVPRRGCFPAGENRCFLPRT